MKNQIIDGIEYAVNLKGELYEVMIPGTKCPVSAGVLEQWYWNERITLKRIEDRIASAHSVSVNFRTLSRIFKKLSIRTRDSKAYAHVSRKNIKNASNEWQSTDEGIDSIIRAGDNFRKSKNGIRHLKRLPKIGNDAMKKKYLDSRPVYKCVNCDKEFSIRSSGRRSINKFCSLSCANSFNGKIRYDGLDLDGISCPHCNEMTMRFCGKYRAFRQFSCRKCKKCTHCPIIELGLRQDLEAAGALDDGRILASAFQGVEAK